MSMIDDSAAWPPPTPDQRYQPPPRPPEPDTTDGGRPPRDPGLDRSDLRPRPWASRALWVMFGSILLIAGVGWGAFNMVSVLARDEWTRDVTQPAAGLTTLRVDNDNGRVVVRGGDTDEIAVHIEVSRGLFDTTEEASVENDAFVLRGDCPTFSNGWCWVNYDITVPRGLAVVVDSGNSRVTVSDVDGTVNATGQNGRVELARLSGPVVARSDNGRVVGTDLASPTVEAASDNGRIELSFTEPPSSVRATSSNGGVEIVLPDVEDGYAVDADAANGSEDVLVLNNPASLRTVVAESHNGRITVRPAD